MKTAIQIQIVARTIGQFSVGKKADGLGDILRGTPSGARKCSLIDQITVFFMHDLCHIRVDHAHLQLSPYR